MSEQDERERIEQNVRRTTGIHALREIRGIVDEVAREDEARLKLMRVFLRYGWVILLLAAGLLARLLNVSLA